MIHDDDAVGALVLRGIPKAAAADFRALAPKPPSLPTNPVGWSKSALIDALKRSQRRIRQRLAATDDASQRTAPFAVERLSVAPERINPETAFTELNDSLSDAIERLMRTGCTLTESFEQLARHIRSFFSAGDTATSLAGVECTMTSTDETSSAAPQTGVTALAAIGDWLAAYSRSAPLHLRHSASRTLRAVLDNLCVIDNWDGLDGWTQGAFLNAGLSEASLCSILLRENEPRFQTWRSVATQLRENQAELQLRLDSIDRVHERETAAAEAATRFWKKYACGRVFKAWQGVLVESRTEAERRKARLATDRATEIMRRKLQEREDVIEGLYYRLAVHEKNAELARFHLLVEWGKDKIKMTSAQDEVRRLAAQLAQFDSENVKLRARCIVLESELSRAVADVKKLAILSEPPQVTQSTMERLSDGAGERGSAATIGDVVELLEELIDGIAINDCVGALPAELVTRGLELNAACIMSHTEPTLASVTGWKARLLSVEASSAIRLQPIRDRFAVQLGDLALAASFNYPRDEELHTTADHDIAASCSSLTDFVLDEGIPELTATRPIPETTEAQLALRSLNAFFDSWVASLARAPFLMDRTEPRELARLRARARDACRKLAFVTVVRSRAAECFLQESVR